MRSNSLDKESVVGHIPKIISKFSSMFLMILFTPTEVVGKRLNRGGSYGLEISVKSHFYSQGKIVQWVTKKRETVKKS